MPRTSSARQSQAPQTPNRATRGWPQINEAIYMTNAPGQCTAGDDESSGAEIPSRKELKKRSAAKQVQEELDEAQDDQGEPEYVSQAVLRPNKLQRCPLLIRITGGRLRRFLSIDSRRMYEQTPESHPLLHLTIFPQGGVEYHVKWLGYPDEQNTWEPPSNVDDCAPLDKYHEQIGGPPKPAGKTPARADSKKRKASSSAVDSPTVSGSTSRGAKKAKAESSTTNGGDIKLAKRDSFKPPAGSWENEIISIETMSVGDDNGLYAYIQWKDGHRSQHRNTVVNSKCPQKVSSHCSS